MTTRLLATTLLALLLGACGTFDDDTAALSGSGDAGDVASATSSPAEAEERCTMGKSASGPTDFLSCR